MCYEVASMLLAVCFFMKMELCWNLSEQCVVERRGSQAWL